MSDIEMIKEVSADDHRGSVEFYNDLDLSAYKRFYIVNNPSKGTVSMAWAQERREITKVIKGSFLVGVEIDNWESPDKKP